MRRLAPKSALGRLKEAVVCYDTFGVDVYCVAGPYEDLPGYLKWKNPRARYELPDDPDGGGLYFNSGPGRADIIWLKSVPRTACGIGILAHEVGHAVLEMFGGRDIAVSVKHQEPFCYALAHGVETLLQGLRNGRR